MASRMVVLPLPVRPMSDAVLAGGDFELHAGDGEHCQQEGNVSKANHAGRKFTKMLLGGMDKYSCRGISAVGRRSLTPLSAGVPEVSQDPGMSPCPCNQNLTLARATVETIETPEAATIVKTTSAGDHRGG